MTPDDADFWRGIAEHPAVKPLVSFGTDFDWWTPLLTHPAVSVVRGDHGGYFLVCLDPLGRIFDLHAAITPEGWGRAANALLKRALADLGGWDVVLATEVDGNWRSRPPRSFGFRPAAATEGQYRTWILARDAWENSPARRRMG
jgi:hypothetical protein